uniref:Speedy protein E4 n=1 Tax=Castor canadensis TaxID=51338 RepID=A0A8C0XGM7_CASCN
QRACVEGPSSARVFCERRKKFGRTMADQQPSSQSESPQPKLPRQQSYTGVGFLYSAPWEERNLRPQPPCRKRNRDWSSDSEEELEEELFEKPAPQEEEVWEVEMLSGLRMKFKRRRVSSVLPEHHEVFARLLEDPVVKRFLAWDKNLRVSDKYLLAMVVAYFSRAGLFSWQFQRIHFFLALYLANDMEEDNQAPKQDIFYFLYGKNYFQHPLFHKLRYQMMRSMGWRMRVSERSIQAYNPDLWVWGRDRTHLP